jgi:hypothetical protein
MGETDKLKEERQKKRVRERVEKTEGVKREREREIRR